MLNMQFFFRLHVHFAKCMSQNCNYANCMFNMQFENELHVHELNFLVMARRSVMSMSVELQPTTAHSAVLLPPRWLVEG